MPVHHIRLHIASTLSAQVMALGVSPDRIVYAHPCKPPKQIRWSATHGVNLTTFDTESELHKVGGLPRWEVRRRTLLRKLLRALSWSNLLRHAPAHLPALPLCTYVSLQMAQFHPTSGLLLRIRADDPAARCQLGNKVGSGCSCCCCCCYCCCCILHCCTFVPLPAHAMCPTPLNPA